MVRQLVIGGEGDRKEGKRGKQGGRDINRERDGYKKMKGDI